MRGADVAAAQAVFNLRTASWGRWRAHSRSMPKMSGRQAMDAAGLAEEIGGPPCARCGHPRDAAAIELLDTSVQEDAAVDEDVEQQALPGEYLSLESRVTDLRRHISVHFKTLNTSYL